MLQKPDGMNHPGLDSNSNTAYTVCSHPWWHGGGHDTVSLDFTRKNSENPSLPKLSNCDVQINPNMLQDADRKHEELYPQLVASLFPQKMDEYHAPTADRELVGHSIACNTYPYSEQYYGGALPSYGPQALVHSPFLGLHTSIMAPPLEVADEPVYVNAKQYHGILRRRESRAKAELERKVIKARKPYLHESRHLHAMRRARGCGGRFLNTKKLDQEATHAMSTTSRSTNSVATVSSTPSNSSRPMPSHIAFNGSPSGKSFLASVIFLGEEEEGEDMI